MTTAIIIVILILLLSVGLFFLIRKLSHVSDSDSQDYAEEGVISDFNMVYSQQENYTIDEDTIKKSNLKAKFAILVSTIYNTLNNQVKKLNQLKIKYQKRQAEKIKEKEKAIQEVIRLDQETQELELQNKNNLEKDIDTSHFEIDNKAINKENIIATEGSKVNSINSNPESKATDFVEQLLSEVDGISESSTDEDISDTYYYEYMEKRYIDRILNNNKDIEAYKKLGNLYVDMRNYKDALEAFEYVLKLKPNDTFSSRRVKDISNRLQKQG